MQMDQFKKDEILSNAAYQCYHLVSPVRIFNCYLEDDTLLECEIQIASGCNFLEAASIICQYLDWLASCKKELCAYYQEKLGQTVPDNWFETIEVYWFNLTFDSVDSYGITISCGDQIILDHILEFDFDKYQVVADRLQG